jgi:hypothetical protein
MIHAYFTIMKLFFHKVSVICTILMPPPCKTLYTYAIRFPVSTHHKHFVSIRSLLQNGVHVAHLYKAKQAVDAGCQIWAVSRMGRNSPPHFYHCITCARAAVRSGIVVKEKDVFRVSVSANSTDAMMRFVSNFLVLFVVCNAVKADNFTTLVHSDLLNVGKIVLEMTKALWKNSLIIAKDLRIIHVNFVVISITFYEKKWTHYFSTAPRN